MIKTLISVVAFAFLSSIAYAEEQSDKAPAQEAEVSAMEIGADAGDTAKQEADAQAQKAIDEAAAAAAADTAK